MDARPETNRHVPEFGLVTGAFLSLSFLVAGLVLTGDVVRTLLTSVVILYPFAAYAITHSPDPTTVLPPRVTSALAVLVGVVLVGAVLADTEPSRVATELPYALFLGALVVLPAAAYHVTAGGADDRLNPLTPPQTVLVATAVSVGLLAYGLLVGGVRFAAATALSSFLAGSLYARARGERLARRTRRRFVAGGAACGVLVVLLGLLRGTAMESWLLVGLCLAAAPTFFYALTAPERA
ncbi:hypothetical protein C2R22_01075 [Salinigranum rubrum]|uniref:Uncharacterized protein n=1 Tax=Salinigranum rubrum TaxID=755307 RepID=A0A2I8VEU4_9EURY|nr:hypothetical protein [Salinigranum rubrum]AUV80421.1 hypothetical protein C2R22_01075 [Salinigranum rubrum]